jgi:eukaryotic-like serine/threonine-protein kinase
LVLEAAVGQHPFAELTTREIMYQLTMLSDPVDVSEVGDERWELLCRGLLTKDRERRWGAEQVEAWLAPLCQPFVEHSPSS